VAVLIRPSIRRGGLGTIRNPPLGFARDNPKSEIRNPQSAAPNARSIANPHGVEYRDM
jgi:hypothetical protein